jgi:hypothetical protein
MLLAALACLIIVQPFGLMNVATRAASRVEAVGGQETVRPTRGFDPGWPVVTGGVAIIAGRNGEFVFCRCRTTEF